jgi:hypothetical protein
VGADNDAETLFFAARLWIAAGQPAKGKALLDSARALIAKHGKA